MKTTQPGEEGAELNLTIAPSSPVAQRLRLMYLYYGRRGDGATCGLCKHFQRFSARLTWAKCALCMRVTGFGMDWRAHWSGCAAWQEVERSSA